MTEPRIITAYTAPSGVRVAVVRLQGRDVTVRQSVKKVTTVWLGSVRLTKQHNSSVWHAAVGAAFDEWEGRNAPAAEQTCPACGESLAAEPHDQTCPMAIWPVPAPAIKVPAAEVVRTVPQGPAAVRQSLAVAAAVQGQTTARPVTPEELTLAVALEPRDGATQDAAQDTARHIRQEADRLAQAFQFAAPTAPIWATIRNLRAVAAALEAAQAPAEEPAPAALPEVPCYHVTINGGELDGRTYGVAALHRTEAVKLATARLSREGFTVQPTRFSVTHAGSWQAALGTVLAY